jgi:sensory rhodopsin
MNEILAATSLDGGLSVNAITQYLFWVGTVAMGCGTAFFWLERSNVAPQYRSTMTVAGLVTAVACFHYYRMAGVYSEGEFPTAYRYIDWIITTPLLLVKFPMLLGLGKNGKGFLLPLIILDVAMIITAYIAEVSPVGGGNWWLFFIAACIFEFGIVYVLFVKMKGAIGRAPAPIARSLRIMRGFIGIGWAIYPIGFLMALSGPAGGDLREIFYNIADVVNKVGFGLVAYLGIKTISEMTEGKTQEVTS